MSKGQGAVEYLLVVVAVLTVAASAIFIANSMLSSNRHTAEEKINTMGCSIQGIQFPDDFKSYDGTTSTKPDWIKPCGTCSPLAYSGTGHPPDKSKCVRYASCSLGGYNVVACLSKSTMHWGAYLQSGGGYLIYDRATSGGSGGSSGNKIYPSSWSANNEAYNAACAKSGETSAKPSVKNSAIISNVYCMNLTFNCPESGEYGLYVYEIYRGYKEVGQIQCGDTSTKVEYCNQDSLGRAITVCGGTSPSDEYAHPPYLKKVSS